MARFIVASRYAGPEEEPRARSSDALHTLHATLGVEPAVAPSDDPSRVQIWEGTERDFQARRAEFAPHLIIEPELDRSPCLVHPLAQSASGRPLLTAGLGATIDIIASSDGAPLQDALALLYLQSVRGLPPTTAFGTTAADGLAAVPFDPWTWTPVAAAVLPRSGAWSTLAPVQSRTTRVMLPALPRHGPLAWWHRVFGISASDPRLGEGIRVGIVDTGIGDHPYLQHATRVGAFVNGAYDNAPEACRAVSDHGTHVAGIIGARPTDPADFAGIAPGADLFIARAYPGGGPPGAESGPATNADIAQAILTLSRDKQCDLINISSAGLMRSEIEASRIDAALAYGALVVCSVGNGGGPPVMFPAAEPAAIGVTALGLVNTVPFGVLDSMNMPQTPDRYVSSGVYSPNFASYGPEVKCAGPGVGIVSTVPPFGENQAPYAAMSGTSMAAPALVGALAALLSRDSVYTSLPRTIERSRRAMTLLSRCLRSPGLMLPFQGFGLPYLKQQ